MIEKVMFKKGQVTEFLGRNGRCNCVGVEVMLLESKNKISLTPYSTKGLGRGEIQIPKDPDIALELANKILAAAGVQPITAVQPLTV